MQNKAEQVKAITSTGTILS